MRRKHFFALVVPLFVCVLGWVPDARCEGKTKIAVFDLNDAGVGAEVTSLLTGRVCTRLSELGIFDVISNEDVKNILILKQKNMLLGCRNESCFVDIGDVLGVVYLVTGQVGKVGEKYVIGLQRIDVKASKVVRRIDRQFEGSVERLLAEVANASYKVVEDVLEAQSGKVLLSVSEEGADISVDDKIVGASPMKQLSLPAGPRDIRVSKKGFVDWTRTIQVEPNGAQMLEVTMIPSAEFISAYEDRAKNMRMWAWITLGAFVALEAGAIGLRTYTFLEYDPIEDDYANGNYRGMTASEFWQKYHDDMDLAEVLDYTALGLGIAGVGLGVLSLYFFLEGDDPDRYEKFRGFEGGEGPAVSIMPTEGGGSLALRFDF